MVDEEVVQLIGAHEVLGLLLDGAVGLGGDELGADGGVHDIEQDITNLGLVVVHSLPLYEVTHESLGDTGIHAIHRHVVAIICSPSEGQLRKIARTDDDGVLTIGHIHEELGTLTRLTVLIGSVVHFDIVLDILEVLYAGLLDADLSLGDTQEAHEVERVLISAVGGAEAWHGDTDDARTGQAEAVEGAHRSKQC